MSSLHSTELDFLNTLASSPLAWRRAVKEGQSLPRELIRKGLARYDMAGTPCITEKGEHLLFQSRCRAALEHLDQPMPAGVRQWLHNCRYVVQADDGSLQVSERGAFWLASLDAPLPTPSPLPRVHRPVRHEFSLQS